MTSRKELIDFPPELITHIISDYVNIVGVSEAWVARGVCRIFNASIRYEVINNVPIDDLTKMRDWPTANGRDERLQRIFRRNLGAMLASPTRRKANPHWLTYVEARAEDLISAEHPNNPIETRDRYVRKIMEYISQNIYTPTTNYFIDPPKTHVETSAFNDELTNDSSSRPKKFANLVAAAAVGNYALVKCFLEADDIWPSGNHDGWTPFSCFGGLLSGPLRAAAFSGKLVIVQYLLASLRTPDKVSVSQEELHGAIHAAILSRRTSIVKSLVTFARSLNWDVTGEWMACCDEQNCYNLWVACAVKSGCYETSESVLKALHPRLTSKPSPITQTLFKSACENGPAQLVLRLLHEDKFLGVGRFATTQGLMYAVKHGRREVIRMMISMGADIDWQGILWDPIQRGDLSTLKFLMVKGAHMDELYVKYIETYLAHKQYLGLRSLGRTSMKALTFYYVLKTVGSGPGYSSAYPYSAALINDVEDSKSFSKRAEIMFEQGEKQVILWK
ncbi:hypothetical protein NX059_001445 [Plenodomus lindquistii]|nr:hypothetical protein NX059_001445 [Plenodomus lindquistii]